MAATIELCSRQATEETVSPLRLRTGATRMKGISVVLFPPFSVTRNRVLAPLCPASSNFRVALLSPRHVCGLRVETSWRYNRDLGQRRVEAHLRRWHPRRNKCLPAAEEAYLIIGDGELLPVACYGGLDLVLHCERYGKPWSNVRVTLKNVAAVPGIWFDLISFNQIQETHPVLLGKEGAHILGSRILFTKHANGNFVQATKVAHHGSPAVCLNPGMPATTVPSATVPPAMAAAVLRPGATTSADINDLHASLGHVHEGNLRETAKQMRIRLMGTLVPCSECAVAKGIRRSVSRSTARRVTRPLEFLYGDLSGAMPVSTGGSVYCFFIVNYYSNLGWPVFLKHKSADTVTHAFRAFLAAIKPLREKHGEPGALRTDNGTEFVNEPFANLLAKHGIRRKFTSVDGPKRNDRVERWIALFKEGARAAWLGFPCLFPDVRLPSRAMHYSAVRPEAWTWMSENINITSRVDGPDKRCPEEKLYGKRLCKQLLTFLIPGHRTRGSGPKWAGKADPCFYLNGGNDHASDCDKVMLESGIASYTTNATYAYRRAPFVGQQVTSETGPSALLHRRRSPRRWEGVEPPVWLVNRGKATPSPLPLRHRPHLQRGGETSAFCEVTRAAEGALGGASPFLHCRRSHRRRKETPAVYEINRRSGVNRTA